MVKHCSCEINNRTPFSWRTSRAPVHDCSIRSVIFVHELHTRKKSLMDRVATRDNVAVHTQDIPAPLDTIMADKSRHIFWRSSSPPRRSLLFHSTPPSGLVPISSLRPHSQANHRKSMTKYRYLFKATDCNVNLRHLFRTACDIAS